MDAARLAIMVNHDRCGGDYRLALFVFAIEHAHRIPFEPRPAILAQLVERIGEMRFQLFAIGRAARAASDRIQLDFKRRHAEPLHQGIDECDHFGVNRRAVHAERLRADLMKLAKPTGLRAFVPEHRQHVIELFRRDARRGEVMLVIRPHDRRCPFRAERHVPFALVADDIHLFLHNIGILPDASRKEF